MVLLTQATAQALAKVRRLTLPEAVRSGPGLMWFGCQKRSEIAVFCMFTKRAKVSRIRNCVLLILWVLHDNLVQV